MPILTMETKIDATGNSGQVCLKCAEANQTINFRVDNVSNFERLRIIVLNWLETKECHLVSTATDHTTLFPCIFDTLKAHKKRDLPATFTKLLELQHQIEEEVNKK